MDFILKQYMQLLIAPINRGYFFQTFEEFLKNPKGKVVVLRHDVDRLPQNSLQTAIIESQLGIKGSYYFRALPESWDEEVIKEIHKLGHEVGYHYENLSTCHGDMSAATKDFEKNLEKLRKLVPVSTICMHGSPMTKWDSRDLWQKYDYRTEGIIGEPYLDINWNEVFYLTDTGRRWDGGDVSIRDKVRAQRKSRNIGIQSKWPVYHSTKEIIKAIDNGSFPKKVMITTHPQRWTNNPFLWSKELVWQNVKNVLKKILVSKSRK